jgi:hypothetical protein
VNGRKERERKQSGEEDGKGDRKDAKGRQESRQKRGRRRKKGMENEEGKKGIESIDINEGRREREGGRAGGRVGKERGGGGTEPEERSLSPSVPWCW